MVFSPSLVLFSRISLCFCVEKNMYELLKRRGAFGAFLYFVDSTFFLKGRSRLALSSCLFVCLLMIDGTLMLDALESVICD
ncbi:hypothetical protein IV203_022758 [Nitzschia inconspicua]|uniref:Uncharacterized protein n=1 Tax=Nitzschia inconspicua TaxID=303405 RepID=A0A9K3K6B8_9STRA|nr:hypothetical protein IV203_022758 [Nitzschia inconspicua]